MAKKKIPEPADPTSSNWLMRLTPKERSAVASKAAKTNHMMGTAHKFTTAETKYWPAGKAG